MDFKAADRTFKFYADAFKRQMPDGYIVDTEDGIAFPKHHAYVKTIVDANRIEYLRIFETVNNTFDDYILEEIDSFFINYDKNESKILNCTSFLTIYVHYEKSEDTELTSWNLDSSSEVVRYKTDMTEKDIHYIFKEI